MNNLVVTLQNLGRIEYLYNPQLLEDIESKLPPVMLMLWSNVSATFINGYSLMELNRFISTQSRVLSARVGPKGFVDDKPNRGATHKVFAASEKPKQQTVNVTKKCAFYPDCDEKCDNLTNCRLFAELSVDDRWKLVREKNLCFTCLKWGHSV